MPANALHPAHLLLQVRQVLSYERDRIRFLLKAYLRARLEKVQRFAGTQRQPGRQEPDSTHLHLCVSHSTWGVDVKLRISTGQQPAAAAEVPVPWQRAAVLPDTAVLPQQFRSCLSKAIYVLAAA
jgi:hypothetical protein